MKLTLSQKLILWATIFVAGILTCSGQQKAPEKPRYEPKKYTLGAGVYYSRSINQWNGNKWNGNVISMVVYDNKKWTPNVGYWYDPITKARGVTFGIKLIDFKIKK